MWNREEEDGGGEITMTVLLLLCLPERLDNQRLLFGKQFRLRSGDR